MKVLIAASECVPLVKTGGLADVIGALPGALAGVGVEARVLLPGYPGVLSRIGATPMGSPGQGVDLGPPPGVDPAIAGAARLVEATVDTGAGALAVLVLDAPGLFDRTGGLYEHGGADWPDNAERFAALAQAAAGIARHGIVGRGGARGAGPWRPDVLHANDWQTGLAPVYAAQWGTGVPTVLTIHNIAYQGLFDASLAPRLGLAPAGFGSGWEFYGELGFLKGGLMAADRITTVSPGYAREIVTPAFGMRLEGVLAARRDRLSGILNGADTAVWDPATDPAVAAPFSAADPAPRAASRAALAEAFALEDTGGPVLAVVSRLTWQKGIDLLLGALPGFLATGGRLVLLGSGDAALETALGAVAAANPGRVGLRIGYDETLSHRIFAGADAIGVPSRFEPCGLTQLYALRYGALAVVARTGGLGDTVIDATPAALAAGAATGFVHDPDSAAGLADALARMRATWDDRDTWAAMQAAAMRSPVGWGPSAAAYAALYREIAAA
ncbi:MAG: glycogen synthase GlgA [Pseudomonadota bacterium]